MPKKLSANIDRLSFRIPSDDKALLIRAATLQHINLTDFVIRNVMPIAQEIIAENKRIVLAERDSLCVLDLLDNPPKPNKKLMAVARKL